VARSYVAFFDAIARRYDRVYARTGHDSRRRLARVLRELAPRSTVLDLGVGTGRELPALLDAGHEVVGLDVSTEMLAIARRRSRPIALMHGDLWDPLPFEDASFDAVLALHGTLAHPPSEDAFAPFVREVARVLRPGGVFVAEVPRPEWVASARGVAPEGAGTGRFVDEATGAGIDIVAPSPVQWKREFATVMPLEIDTGSDDELLLVARRG